MGLITSFHFSKHMEKLLEIEAEISINIGRVADKFIFDNYFEYKAEAY